MVIRAIHANWRQLHSLTSGIPGFSTNAQINNRMDLVNNLQGLTQKFDSYIRGEQVGAGSIDTRTLEKLEMYRPRNIAIANKLDKNNREALAVLERIGGGLLDLKA